MKAAAFDYARPRTLDEAVALLADGNGAAKVLAGGQSLGPMLNLRLARPRLLVDISRLPELRRMHEADDHWEIGGGVTHAEIEDAGARLRGAEVLARVAGGIAYRSVRNRGTIGGSVAHADPAGDWLVVLASLGASIRARGPAGERDVSSDRVMKAAFTTELRDDEIIATVRVPKLASAARFGYFKFCRKAGEFPEASAAVLLDPERRSARVFLGALEGAPRPLPELAQALIHQGAAAAIETAAVDAVRGIGDFDAPELRMRAAVLRRALSQAFPQ
ncbi:MAG TPA: FAD binding domain-containing protein [Stellaceae bacterium]|nr:FAD binding domain-containing protein [Stellaceae bacterium]